MMTPEQFEAAAALARVKPAAQSYTAARLVLVGGESRSAAARAGHLSQSAVSQACKRISGAAALAAKVTQ